MQIVCVIDDEASIRKGLTNLLRSAGYLAVGFGCGESFLASPWRHRAACVLLDLQLPGLQGDEVLGALKTEIPVICLSAQANDQQIAACIAQGASFLAKPCSGDTLLNTIASCLEAHS